MENRERCEEFWNKICQRFLFVPIIVIVVSVLVIGLNWYDRVVSDVAIRNVLLNGQAVDANIKEEVSKESENKVSNPQSISKMTESDAKIEINSASIEELMRLPGIGKVRAFEIVEMREKMGGFRTLEDLMCVEGLGIKTFEGLKEFIEIKQIDAE